MPLNAALSKPHSPYLINLDDYKTELVAGLSKAWQLAQSEIKKAQRHQKKQHDEKAKDEPLLCMGGSRGGGFWGCNPPKWSESLYKMQYY